MNRNFLVLIIIVLLVWAGGSASAGEWRRYKYCKKHTCMDGCYKDKHFRLFKPQGEYMEPDKNKEMKGKYYHTYKNYERHDGEGYYEYYDSHNKLYYNKSYKDNYRPEVDGNK